MTEIRVPTLGESVTEATIGRWFKKAGEAGYLCMWADEKYGGLGLKDFRYEQILIEENAAHGDSGYFITLHSRLVAPYLQHFGTEEQKQRYLPKLISGETILAIAMTEPDAGSDLAGMKARAEDKGDHWLLNGSKTYISNGILADLVIVAAKTHPDNPHGVTLFLVERGMEGFERGRNLAKMGLHAQDTAELSFTDVRVPAAHLVGPEHAGFLLIGSAFLTERIAMAAQACGQARRPIKLLQQAGERLDHLVQFFGAQRSGA